MKIINESIYLFCAEKEWSWPLPMVPYSKVKWESLDSHLLLKNTICIFPFVFSIPSSFHLLTFRTFQLQYYLPHSRDFFSVHKSIMLPKKNFVTD